MIKKIKQLRKKGKSMEIKVLGSGCANCNKLEKLVEEAAKELGITDSVIKVTEIQDILKFGVMSTPALVVDGKVKFSGRVPSREEIKKYLKGETGTGGCSCGGRCC
jgi:small redox-active disulfide protein 2